MNHEDGKVDRIYKRHEYLAEKREALERWEKLPDEADGTQPLTGHLATLTTKTFPRYIASEYDITDEAEL